MMKTEDVVGKMEPTEGTKRKLSSSGTGNSGGAGGGGNPRRKRKTFSCASCRKLKTRCDFEPQVGKCHRCSVLKLDCSLTHERKSEIDKTSDGVDEETEETGGNSGSANGSIRKLEGEILSMKEKLDLLCDVLVDKKLPINEKIRGNSDYEYFKGMKSKVNYLDNSTNNSPWNVINRIDFKLFKRFKKYEIFAKLCKEDFIIGFFEKNQDFCLRLANNFLNKAHFWIIPGGLTKIDKSYVLRNPFITSVFILISLNFDHEGIKSPIEDELQKKLYWIVRKILGLAMTITPLTDHDSEAILYCSIYSIARKSEQPQLDTWLISGSGIKQMMITTKFHDLLKRVELKNFDMTDLFHLRIWNSLCISHVQNSIGYGRPFLISEDYFHICEWILKFPQINIEDNVRYAELQVSRLCYDLFYEKNLMLEVIRLDQFKTVEEGVQVVEFNKLHDWFCNNEALIDQDISNILMFCYEFYHIILTKRIISAFSEDGEDYRVVKFQKIGLNSIIHYSHALINRFLSLETFLIKGSPNFLLNIIIYTSLTLYENLINMIEADKRNSINLITKIYWKLNQIGESQNDATDTVGKIIKNLVLDNLGPHDPTNGTTSTSTMDHSSLETHQEGDYEPLHDDVNNEYSNDYNVFKQQQTVSSLRSTSVIENSGLGFEIPDVGKFDTFEDFFKDMFR